MKGLVCPHIGLLSGLDDPAHLNMEIARIGREAVEEVGG